MPAMNKDHIPLANCPKKGTPIRGCAIPFDELPDLLKLRLRLDEVATFDWSIPKVPRQGPTIHNVCMRNLDEFICSFESSREKGDLEEFKKARLRPEFASLPEEEILRQMACFAQDRALMINYLLGSRVSPVYHQDYVDKTRPPDTKYEREELKKDRPRIATKMVEAFWGFEHSGNPLPTHEHKLLGISAYDGWAERIDDKLIKMAKRLNKDPQRLRDLPAKGDTNEGSKSNPIVIESDDSSKEVNSEPKRVQKKVTGTKGTTKFTKEVSGERHTAKKRAVLPNQSNLSSSQAAEQELDDAEEMVSPTFGVFPPESPRRKDRKEKRASISSALKSREKHARN
ncbi:hypothetical protein Daesc_004273 [Daldinia eschscholtzii]|uniref:Uncharacterized protein n=1 Tax=Daldinia eschscholtzii TaxID=292717 RepID=A0AAX6MP94_9PEZI